MLCLKKVLQSSDLLSHLDCFHKFQARKIRVQLLGYNYLQLREVQVLDSRGNNVALNKPAVQSSTYDGLYTASWAVDGQLDSYHMSHTNSEQGPPPSVMV